MNRRTFLRSSGVALALPMLESYAVSSAPAKRLVAINIPLGFHGPNFFPTGEGRDYQPSRYLQPAIDAGLREKMTVFSGLSHPGVDGGHSAEKSFLTAAPHPGSRSFKNTISLDQQLAQTPGVGDATRFASLTSGDLSLSWSANGVPIPSEKKPSEIFSKLFLRGTDAEIAGQKQALDEGHSIMDLVLEDAKAMSGEVSLRDREKLDQYFTAVRETELRLQKAQAWSETPKPSVESEPPGKFGNTALIERLKAHFEVIRLALVTDSTRVVAFGGTNNSIVPALPQVQMGYHALSHHGKNPQMLGQLEVIEAATMQAWAEFIVSLRDTQDATGASLLDSTQVLLGSNLGNASGHLTTNLPIIVAGGGWKHGQHLAFDSKNNAPLPKLYVNLMQEMGVETDRFTEAGSGTLTDF